MFTITEISAEALAKLQSEDWMIDLVEELAEDSEKFV